MSVISARDRCYDFLNIFAEKFSEKIGVFDSNKAKICKILIITLVFEKNANFFAEIWQKSQKIVIITSTPGQYFHKRHFLLFRAAVTNHRASCRCSLSPSLSTLNHE
jgi:hypothetical protein